MIDRFESCQLGLRSQLVLTQEQVATSPSAKGVPPTLKTMFGSVVEHMAALAQRG